MAPSRNHSKKLSAKKSTKCTRYGTNISRYKNTGKWGSWLSCPRRRIYLGAWDTKELAARAQDRAALKIIGPKAHTNFNRKDYKDDSVVRTSLGDEAFTEMLVDESRSCYKLTEKSDCLKKFLQANNTGESKKRVYRGCLSKHAMKLTVEVKPPSRPTSPTPHSRKSPLFLDVPRRPRSVKSSLHGPLLTIVHDPILTVEFIARVLLGNL